MTNLLSPEVSIPDIFHFSSCGDVAGVVTCLDEGTDVDFQNSEGETALQIAAACGCCPLVNLLLKRGACIDLPSNYGWTPLLHSVRNGHSSVTEILLKMKAKVNLENNLGLSPVVAAAWNGDVKTLKLLIEAGAIVDDTSSVNQNNESIFSSLMAAALQGHEDVVELLLEAGMDSDQFSPVTGLTPLMLAACVGHKKIVEIFVDDNTDINRIDVCGKKALDFAKMGRREDIVHCLEAAEQIKRCSVEEESTDIFKMIKTGNCIKVNSILEGNSEMANILHPGDYSTPLILAAKLGHTNIVNALLSHGAAVNAQDFKNGWTPLMYAVFHRHPGVVELLIKNGAAVETTASNGHTALDLAKHLGDSDTAIIENLTKLMSPLPVANSSPLLASRSFSLDRRKLSVSEEVFSTKSETHTGVKSWIGGVAHQLQHKMLSRLSNRQSELSASDTFDDEWDDCSVNDVFMDPTSDDDSETLIELDTSHSLSPKQRFAKELREHEFQPIRPPMPPITYYNPPEMLHLVTTSTAKTVKEPKRILFCVPNLLKKHTRKNISVNVKDDEDIEMALRNDEDFEMTSEPEEATSSSEIRFKVSENHDEVVDEEKTAQGQLTAVLKKESLEKYVQLFRDQEVDIEVLRHLTKDDLSELGIECGDSKKKLLDLISQLQENK